MFSVFYLLINYQNNRDKKKYDSCSCVESNHVVFDNAIAETKNAVANIAPIKTLTQETLSPILGTNEPTTSEPKMIFEPSIKKLETIFS
jgi:hypothetical protein